MKKVLKKSVNKYYVYTSQALIGQNISRGSMVDKGYLQTKD